MAGQYEACDYSQVVQVVSEARSAWQGGYPARADRAVQNFQVGTSSQRLHSQPSLSCHGRHCSIPPRPTRKAAAVNSNPGLRFKTRTRRSSEEVRAEKEEAAAKKAASQKNTATVRKKMLQNLAAMNDKIAEEDRSYQLQEQASNLRKHASASSATNKKVPVKAQAVASQVAERVEARSTSHAEVVLTHLLAAMEASQTMKPAKLKVVDSLSTAVSRPVTEMANLEGREGPTKGMPEDSVQYPMEDSEKVQRNFQGSKAFDHRLRTRVLPTNSRSVETMGQFADKGNEEPIGNASADSGSEYHADEAEEPSEDEHSVVDEEAGQLKPKKGGKCKASDQSMSRDAKKSKACGIRYPVPLNYHVLTIWNFSYWDSSSVLSGLSSPLAVPTPKRKDTPDQASSTETPSAKRAKPALAQGLDSQWLKDNVSRGAVKKTKTPATGTKLKALRQPAAETDVATPGTGGLEDENAVATAAMRDAKVVSGKKMAGKRTIASMGLKATIAPDTDAAVKKEAEAVKPLRLQGMDDIPFRNLDEYRIFDSALVTATLDWAGAADDPFGTNEHPQINKILQKIWDEVLPDNPLNVSECLAVKKVMADRFNNYQSGIGKAGRTVVYEHLQVKQKLDPNLDIKTYAKLMAPRTKPFLYLYKDPEFSDNQCKAQAGAFESELVLKVFAMHLKRVASSPLDFHAGHPVGALALAAVSVERAFKEHQQVQATSDDKGIAFGSNEWGNSAVGWTAYLPPVDEYEERATMAVSDQEDGDEDEDKGMDLSDGEGDSTIAEGDGELAEVGEYDEEDFREVGTDNELAEGEGNVDDADGNNNGDAGSIQLRYEVDDEALNHSGLGAQQ
ncbi:hypothetical protein K488DRAFT_74358 [Vararia minispora EC-137]|uniref:Uncharacterized protein n=1 Tax=Vararia minispora EC-137 TaxID=1314806 RepID=A0ACB8Q7B5_9AGAM|nr:hypothetical protein K488DRAFT_74358 [Vararia minispora EC-137]